MPFGHIVIGPPGSGKTTYCNGMHQFLSALGRKTVVVNLDPANESMQYECAVNIEDLITLDDAMDAYQLGPNGGMVYCIEYLEKNMQWLLDRLAEHEDCYFIFDCPGQVELYTHNQAIKNIVRRLEKSDFRLACVHLVDASYCTEASRFISVLLLSLTTMTMLEMPHINALSKIDLLNQMGQLDFNLEYYTTVMDLDYLLHHLNNGHETGEKFASLNRAICELIEDFSMVGFSTLCITDKHSVAALLKEIDKANGYIFGALTEGNESILLAANATDMLTEARNAQARYGLLTKAPTDADADASESDDVGVLRGKKSGIDNLVERLTIKEHAQTTTSPSRSKADEIP